MAGHGPTDDNGRFPILSLLVLAGLIVLGRDSSARANGTAGKFVAGAALGFCCSSAGLGSGTWVFGITPDLPSTVLAAPRSWSSPPSAGRHLGELLRAACTWPLPLPRRPSFYPMVRERGQYLR